MKKQNVRMMIDLILNELIENEHLTETKKTFITRIIDDCLYNTNHNINKSTITRYIELNPEIFNDDTKL